MIAAQPAGDIVDGRAADRARIQRHLTAVEADLRARDVDHLPPALQAARRTNLDRLRAYRVAGEFPANTRHPGERVPYFIDDHGVLCAVGHLVAESGFMAVARDIQARENNALLLDMTHPALPAWIAASGLTAEECARIQPNYCGCPEDKALVCGVDGRTYLNVCEATTCAGVEVAHEGMCKGVDTTTGWPEAGSEGGSSGGSSESSGGSSGESGASESSGEGDPDDGQSAAKGCRVAGPDAGLSLIALLLLGLRRRVRV